MATYESSMLMNIYIPLQLHEALKNVSKQRGLPMQRLVGHLIDNALHKPELFDYPCTPPPNDYVPDTHLDNAKKIYDFLPKLRNATSIDTLMMYRYDIGIPDKEEFMEAYRAGVNAGALIEIPPPPRTKFKGFKSIYRIAMQYKPKESKKKSVSFKEHKADVKRKGVLK